MMQNPNSKKKSDGKKPIPSNNDKPKISKTTRACDNCRKKRVRCIRENEGPCKKCIEDNCDCNFSKSILKRGPKKATGSSTGLPTKAEFQKWGEDLWQLFGKDRQAILRFLSSVPPNFDQNIQPSIIVRALALGNEQSSSLSDLNTSFSETFLGNEQVPSDLIQANILTLGKNSDGRPLSVNNESFSQETPCISLFDPQEASSINLFNNLEINEQLSGDPTESFLTSNEYTSFEIRSPRSTNRQYSLHRSQSRDNRHNRQETRSRKPVSRSPSPNYRASMYSDEEQNLNLFPYSQVCYSPGYLSPNIPINYCTSNNSSASTSAHIPSSPCVPLDLDDTNLVDYINLQVISVNSNSDEMNQHLLINSTSDIQTSPLDDSEEIPFSDNCYDSGLGIYGYN
ncbi:540_t:CDS:1 [Cetraspora pellucida]|uniref:540_t:CDS:1 n=1 Tax=Cetraspora pellucida TaxID=1433469 RepID=A0A9N9HH92_9GLOM|nr:540_t:CDS:1 [Cetraspora pellucida]